MIILLKILGALPLDLRILIGRFFGFIYSFIPGRERRIAELQLRGLLGVSKPAPLIRRMFRGLGQTAAECLNLKPYLNDIERYVSCPEYAIYERLSQDKSRPIVILTGHTGNWDLLAAYGVCKGIPITSIAKEARNKSFQRALESIRSGYGSRTIWRSNRAGIREIKKDISENRVVAALIDQDTVVTSIASHFFGSAVRAPSGLVEVGNQFNARYLAVFMARTGWKSYEVSVRELPSNGSINETIDAYHRALEDQIRRFPDQWVWFHKRWRSMEDGKRLSTGEYLEYLSKLKGATSAQD